MKFNKMKKTLMAFVVVATLVGASSLVAGSCTCTETDGGKDYYEKGITSGYTSSGDDYNKEDYCKDSSHLIEYYCTSGSTGYCYFQKKQDCSPGFCEDGACVENNQSQPEPECTDSDGGLDFYEQGSASVGNNQQQDYCSGNDLVEAYCLGGDIQTMVYECPYKCDDGECIEEEPGLQCTDTDGGKAYYEKGMTYGYTSSGDAYNKEDYCKDSSHLIEYYCTSGSLGYGYSQNKQDCSPGFCENGACVEQDYCIEEGKISNTPTLECCSGLTKTSNSWPEGNECVQVKDASFICTYCGNGVCGKGENWCNCPGDCGNQTSLERVLMFMEPNSYTHYYGSNIMIYIKAMDYDGTPSLPKEGTKVELALKYPSGKEEKHSIDYNVDSGYYVFDPGMIPLGEYVIYAKASKDDITKTSHKLFFKIVGGGDNETEQPAAENASPTRPAIEYDVLKNETGAPLVIEQEVSVKLSNFTPVKFDKEVKEPVLKEKEEIQKISIKLLEAKGIVENPNKHPAALLIMGRMSANSTLANVRNKGYLKLGEKKYLLTGVQISEDSITGNLPEAGEVTFDRSMEGNIEVISSSIVINGVRNEVYLTH